MTAESLAISDKLVIPLGDDAVVDPLAQERDDHANGDESDLLRGHSLKVPHMDLFGHVVVFPLGTGFPFWPPWYFWPPCLSEERPGGSAALLRSFYMRLTPERHHAKNAIAKMVAQGVSLT